MKRAEIPRPVRPRNLARAQVRIPVAAEPKYILGHSPMEMRRLMTQADVLRPITERLLRAAGVNHGMRVLDVGCGVGDVSMLVAELVGPAGFVVGIDRNADAVAMQANARARSAGLKNVDFRLAARPSLRCGSRLSSAPDAAVVLPARGPPLGRKANPRHNS
jgi:SAM-dependent methyltransferase